MFQNIGTFDFQVFINKYKGYTVYVKKIDELYMKFLELLLFEKKIKDQK